jgi:hypothetical protein
MGFAPVKSHRFGQPSATGKLPFSRPLSQRLKPFFQVLPHKGDKKTISIRFIVKIHTSIKQKAPII